MIAVELMFPIPAPDRTTKTQTLMFRTHCLAAPWAGADGV
jgi:hypothetical protein